MKFNEIIYGLSVVAVLPLASCADFLDTVPDTRVDPNTDEQLAMVLVDSYPVFNYALMTEFSSDNVEDNNAPDSQGNRNNLSSDKISDEIFAWEPVTATSGNDCPSNVWSGYYMSIAGANAVLEKLEEKQAQQGGVLNETQKAIKGEALMIRAYGHFTLANIFCEAYRGPELSKNVLGIYYIKKPETTVKPHYDRGNLADTYANIEADILEGLPLINNGLYSVPKYHFNTAAAHAFAARFYLFSRKYELAWAHANAAFGGECTHLVDADAKPYLTDYWRKIDKFYTLMDHGLYNQNVANAHNFLLIPTYSGFLRYLSGARRYAVTRDALYATFYSNGPTWSNYQFGSANGTGGYHPMNPCYAGCLWLNGKNEYGLFCSANLAEQFEITDKINSTGYAHLTRAEFTGEETLLVRAEAKLFVGNGANIQSAVEDLALWDANRNDNYWLATHQQQNFYKDLTLESVRSFYSSPEAQAYGVVKPIFLDEVCPSTYRVTGAIEPLLQCVQHFRRLETIHTGMRWFDIKRFGLEITRKIGKDRVEVLTKMDPRKANQIPSEVIAAGHQPNKRIPVSSEPQMYVPVFVNK